MRWTRAGKPVDKRGMSDASPPPAILRRIDPSRDMARFYCLTLKPTLFGEVSVIRAWGRIGTRGRVKIDSYSTETTAEAAFSRLEKAKRSRGYSE